MADELATDALTEVTPAALELPLLVAEPVAVVVPPVVAVVAAPAPVAALPTELPDEGVPVD